MAVTMCKNCESPVSDWGLRAARSPTGWVHWGFWQGIRCAGDVTGAEPGRRIGWNEYLAWVDVRLERLGCPP